jgi:hypothetical protein
MLTYDAIAAAQQKYEELTAIKPRPEVAPVIVIEPSVFDRILKAIRTASHRKPASRRMPGARHSLATE